MQRGYLYSRQEEPAKALQDFRAARATGEAPAGAMLDEGYALAGTGDSRAPCAPSSKPSTWTMPAPPS